MTSTREADLLVRTMNEERDLLEQIMRLETQLKAFVVERSWEGLVRTVGEIDPVAQRLTEVEARRDATFKELQARLGAGPEAGFYQIVVLLPEAERERMAEAYRRLRLAVLGIQGLNTTIDAYLRTVIQTVHDVLGELYPFRKGKIYSRRGKAKPVHSNPMVVSRRL